MNTPICDFVAEYAKKKTTRFHMPGHKGEGFLGCELLDITEVLGADVLFQAEGIIAESEANATALFETKQTFFATGGSTQCISAMLYLAVLAKGDKHKRNKILAGRNAHKAFLHGCALLDLDVEWLYPEASESICACPISAKQVEIAFATGELPIALYLTSPDYLGGMADIVGIASVCKAHDVLLLIDNAHGAYLKFLPESLHPMDLGADLCSDSAHKTLPVLTGGAYLHVSKMAKAQDLLAEYGKKALALFGSTSPSYLTMQSLDYCNFVLANTARVQIAEMVLKINTMVSRLECRGFVFRMGEPLKIVFDCNAFGYDGEEFARLLRAGNIEPEFIDENFVVLMISLHTKDEDFVRLEEVLQTVAIRTAYASVAQVVQRGQQRLSIREAIFSANETIPVELAEGRILATQVVSCPPAIPIAISGEEISKASIAEFLRYGITHIDVVR